MKARTVIGVGGLASAAILLAPAAAAASATAGPVLYVAPDGSDAVRVPCTRTAPCRTISHAVTVAHPGTTVLVAPGHYRDSVTISKRLRLASLGPGTVIDATGSLNGISLGIHFTSPTSPAPVGDASGSVVDGFTVVNATQEGIVALGSHLSILNNIVAYNDRGATAPHPAGECAGEGQIPGDCGEGVHLAGVTYSVLRNNYVTANQGGILVSDEFGPTAHNYIARNAVVNNVPDCGITLAAHNGNALSATGRRQPRRGGVYRNAIVGNAVNANGAAGVGFFAGGPRTGSYDNLAEGNSISSNGIPGVAIHTHTPNSDTNGNRIVGNFLSRNGLGEGGRLPLGDPDTPVTTTTDIDVVADPGATPITGTVISHNRITNVAVGIWLVTSGHTDIHGNTFVNVRTRVKRS